MRLSAKAKYGLSALISMASNNSSGACVTVVSLATKLSISKIYLEQVFSLLKRAGLVTSIKGSQGGYQLARQPKDISAYEILASIETGLFEKADSGDGDSDQPILSILQRKVFDPLDECLKNTLARISLEELAEEHNQGFMYYL